MQTITTTPRFYDVVYVDRARERRPLPPPAPRTIAYAREIGTNDYVIPFVSHWRLGTRDEAIDRAEKLQRTVHQIRKHRRGQHHV